MISESRVLIANWQRASKGCPRIVSQHGNPSKSFSWLFQRSQNLTKNLETKTRFLQYKNRSLLLNRNLARTPGTFWRLWSRGSQPATIYTMINHTRTTFKKQIISFAEKHSNYTRLSWVILRSVPGHLNHPYASCRNGMAQAPGNLHTLAMQIMG